MNAVEAVQDALAKMPANSTYDDIMYKIYIMRAIEKGLSEADAGNLIPHGDVIKRFEEWRASRGLPPRQTT